MIAWFRKLLSRAMDEREAKDIREQIAIAEDVLASTHAHLQRLRERERRLNSRMLLRMEPDQIVRQSGAGA